MVAEEYEAVRDRGAVQELLAFAAGVRKELPEHLLARPQQSVDFIATHRVIGRLIKALDAIAPGKPELGSTSSMQHLS